MISKKKKGLPHTDFDGPRGHCPPCPPLVGPAGKMLCCLYAMTGRWASPTCSMLRCNTASRMKDLIYHIPVVFFQFIILIVLIGGAEF